MRHRGAEKSVSPRRRNRNPWRCDGGGGAAPGHLITIKVNHRVGDLDLARRGGGPVGLACSARLGGSQDLRRGRDGGVGVPETLGPGPVLYGLLIPH
jgi:hypothetical protein